MQVSQLEQEQCELVQQMKNFESQFNKHPDHLVSKEYLTLPEFVI